jgi:hypothetical protein
VDVEGEAVIPVSTYWQLGASSEGSIRIMVTAPEARESEPAGFRLTCK